MEDVKQLTVSIYQQSFSALKKLDLANALVQNEV